MTHLSDKELDRLSRDASEQFDVDQNTSGWDVLEKVLDKEIPIDEKKKRRPFFLLFLLFILLGGTGLVSLFVYSPAKLQSTHPATSDKKLTSINPRPEPPINNNGVSKPERKEEVPISAQVTPGDASSIHGVESSDDEKIESEIVSNSGKQSKLNFSKNQSSKNSSNRGTNEIQNNQPMSSRNSVENKNEQKVPVFHSPDLKQATLSIHSIAGLDPLNGHSHIPGSALLNHQMLLNPDLIKGQQSIKLKPETKEALNRQFEKGVFLGITGGPDKSNVNFNTSSEPGFNAGIIAGYRLNRRWSLNTGIIYTKKAYTALGEDFYPPKTGWFNNIEIKSVEGDCIMFDIPLNIRYDLLALPKTRVFISTGLSTYLMTKETYEYHYTYGGTYGRREVTYSDQKIHPFSVINLSAGIEHTLYKKISVQAEPYLKTPFKGVGFGSIRLNSIGAYFTLKYKL